MKKWMAIAIAAMLLSAILVMPVTASDRVEAAGFYEYSSSKNDEVLEGKAGEATTEWNVPYQEIAPVLDGVINAGEYARFENFEDYLSLAVTTNFTAAGADALYEMVRGGIFDAYWCWDGKYMYMAFSVDCVDGYSCTPEQDVLLFAYNCLQIGLADVDAQGKDDSYVELGFGYDNVNDRNITFTWSGQYRSATEDFVGSYDQSQQRVIYELRIDLEKALGLERPPHVGIQCNFAFVLEISGADDANRNAQMMFCHGMAGQYSMKRNEYFARITFTGDAPEQPTEETVVEETLEPDATASEEDIGCEVSPTEPIETFPFEEIPNISFGTIDVPQELPTADTGNSFGKDGLLYEFLDIIEWQGCTSVSAAFILPVLLSLGAVLLKSKDD